MNQKLIIEAYKSIEYKGGEKLGNITVQILDPFCHGFFPHRDNTGTIEVYIKRESGGVGVFILR